MPRYALEISAVIEGLRKLQALNAHRNLPGYLCLVREAGRLGRATDIPKPNFNRFHHEFFEVPGGPRDKPYFIPFRKGGGSGYDCWLQQNTEGSYSRSSYGPNRILHELVEATGSGRNIMMSLKQNHARKARELLLNNQQIPALSLAVFLYRNDEFTRPTITAAELIAQYQADFGYLRRGTLSPDFGVLYSTPSADDRHRPLIGEVA